MKHILFSLPIVLFSTIALAKDPVPAINLVENQATQLTINAGIGPNAFPEPSSVTLENVQITHDGALVKYKVVLNTSVQSYTCDLGKIETVAIMIDRSATVQTINAIGIGPARGSAPCPEMYATKKTKLSFETGTYFYEDDQQKEKIQTFTIGDSGLKIVIKAVKGVGATATLTE